MSSLSRLSQSAVQDQGNRLAYAVDRPRDPTSSPSVSPSSGSSTRAGSHTPSAAPPSYFASLKAPSYRDASVTNNDTSDCRVLAPHPWRNPHSHPVIYLEASEKPANPDAPASVIFAVPDGLAASASPLWATLAFEERLVTPGQPAPTAPSRKLGSKHHPYPKSFFVPRIGITIFVPNCPAEILEVVLYCCDTNTATKPDFASMDDSTVLAVLDVALAQQAQPALTLLRAFVMAQPPQDAHRWQRECWKRRWWDGLAASLREQQTPAAREHMSTLGEDVASWSVAADQYFAACSDALRSELVLYKSTFEQGNVVVEIPWMGPGSATEAAFTCPHAEEQPDEWCMVRLRGGAEVSVRKWLVLGLMALREHLVRYPSVCTLKTCSILLDHATAACASCKPTVTEDIARYEAALAGIVGQVLDMVPFPHHLIVPCNSLNLNAHHYRFCL